MAEKMKVTIWGQMLPMDFDDNEDGSECVVRAAIITDDNEVFFLKDVTSLEHVRLLDYEYRYKNVEADGFVEEDDEGNKLIEVIAFRCWEGYDFYPFGCDEVFSLKDECGLDQLVNYQFELF